MELIKLYIFVLQHSQIQYKDISGQYEFKNVSVIIVQNKNKNGTKFGLQRIYIFMSLIRYNEHY